MSADAATSSSPLAVLMTRGKIQNKPKELKAAFERWVTGQPPWVEAMSTGFFGAFQGAFLGTLMGTITKNAMDPGAGAGKGSPVRYWQLIFDSPVTVTHVHGSESLQPIVPHFLQGVPRHR